LICLLLYVALLINLKETSLFMDNGQILHVIRKEGVISGQFWNSEVLKDFLVVSVKWKSVQYWLQRKCLNYVIKHQSAPAKYNQLYPIAKGQGQCFSRFFEKFLKFFRTQIECGMVRNYVITDGLMMEKWLDECGRRWRSNTTRRNFSRILVEVSRLKIFKQ
jgi:hypothetical protein